MRILLSVPLMLASGAAVAQETETTDPDPSYGAGPVVEIAAGLEYLEGDYGTGTKISSVSVPASLRVSTGRLQLAATLPYRRVEAPANVVPSSLLGLPIIIDPTQPAGDRVVREGLGDLELGVLYALPTRAINLAVTGSVKLPTADENLGTGATDYTVGAEISKALNGKVTPFASFSYTMPGNPEGYSLQDTYALTGGMAATIAPRTQGYVSYRYAKSASAPIADDQRVTTGVTTGIGKRLSLGVYGAAGLSEGAPDVTTGLRIGFALD